MILWTLLSAALAGPCDIAADGMPIGPVTAPVRDGFMATPRRLCARTEFGAGIDGRATIDLANFYGYVAGGLVLDGSVALANDHVEIFGQLEAVRMDLAIASFTSSNLGLGRFTLGATYVAQPSDTIATGVRLRTALPTNTGLFRNARPLGVDLAASVVYLPLNALRIHSELGVQAEWSLGRGARGMGAFINHGYELRVSRAFGVVLDIDAGFGLTAPVDHLDIGFGLRFSDAKRFGFEFGGRVPVAGRAPELAIIGIRASARFGGVTATNGIVKPR